MIKSTKFFVLMFAAMFCIESTAQFTPTAPCNECLDPVNNPIYYKTLYLTRDSPDSCSYTAFAETLALHGPVSVAISGDGFFCQETTVVSRSITCEQTRTVESNFRLDLVAGHGAGISLNYACRSCISSTPICNSSSNTECPDDPDDPCTLGGCKARQDCSCPILIDLDNNNFHLGGEENPVEYDMLGVGVPIRMTWVQPNQGDAFLVNDINGNGVADNGSELFGEGTRLLLEENILASNGFVGLGQFDEEELGGNGDGYISPADSVWNTLMLWIDNNADGYCTPAEMMSINDTNLMIFETIPTSRLIRDPHGNELRWWANAYTVSNRRVKMVDVFFKKLEH